ncbi:MAG: 4-hydroxy-tetrahydrodipicolinate synthase, partial [Pseudomonadota bacterium]|nr:4-hydroxy-tetrahydrodipicolinate synthase [Pseudomonadota bacterium]
MLIGSITALITPFRGGQIDEDALHALVELSAGDGGALHSLEPDGLLQSLLAPPHELELDGLAKAS